MCGLHTHAPLQTCIYKCKNKYKDTLFYFIRSIYRQAVKLQVFIEMFKLKMIMFHDKKSSSRINCFIRIGTSGLRTYRPMFFSVNFTWQI